MLQKVIRWLMVIILMVFAVLQLNDLDAKWWFVVYTNAAAWIASMPKKLLLRRIVLFFIIVYWLAALWLWPDAYHGLGAMHEELPQVEAARESLGLLIAGFMLMVALWLTRTTSSTAPKDS